MLTIEKLEQYGANAQEGLGRCFGNEALYLRLTATVLAEKKFDELHRAIEDQDLTAAFEAAHALKGALANLSLTPLQKPVEEMTELLRKRTAADYTPMLEEMDKQREALRVLCEG